MPVGEGLLTSFQALFINISPALVLVFPWYWPGLPSGDQEKTRTTAGGKQERIIEKVKDYCKVLSEYPGLCKVILVKDRISQIPPYSLFPSFKLLVLHPLYPCYCLNNNLN